MIGLSDFISQEQQPAEKRLRPGGERLRRIAALYREEYIFKPGDLVMWKPGLKDCRVPEYGEPVVVLEVAPGNISSCDDSHNRKYREPCDVRVGVYPDGSTFVGFWMDGKRLQPYGAEKAESVNSELTCSSNCPDGNQEQ